MNLLKHKIWYLIISGLILVPGIIALIIFGLNLSIDFVGGSVVKYQLPTGFESNRVLDIYKNNNIAIESSSIDNGFLVVRTKPLDVQTNKTVLDSLPSILNVDEFTNGVSINQVSFETVGPVVGKETTKNAFVSLGWASLAILLYISYAFRNIPSPYSSFKFGASAIIAMLHDAVVVLGIFSIVGHYKNVEIDAMFITAILTVIGFSVHDTIVVFDRIRENLSKLPKTWQFETIANYSLVETLNRSLATSFTVIFTLLALFILGGDSIKNFVLALLIGIVSGTYSSIFTATPILVIWESYKKRDK